MKRPRGNHTPVFKAKVALKTLCGDKILAELAPQHDIHTNLGRTGLSVSRLCLGTMNFGPRHFGYDIDFKPVEG